MKRKSSTKTCVRAALARAAFGKLRAARRKQKQKFTGAAEHDWQPEFFELALERAPLGDAPDAHVAAAEVAGARRLRRAEVLGDPLVRAHGRPLRRQDVDRVLFDAPFVARIRRHGRLIIEKIIIIIRRCL